MSITSAINAAKSGLQASSLRAEVVASNVSNASTPGYTKRSVVVGENVVGGNTNGVRINGIHRSANAALTNQRMQVTSDQAQADLLSSLWNTLSSEIGDSADGQGLFASLDQLETALTKAAATPESASALEGVKNAARQVTADFQNVSQLSINLRAQADVDIAAGVESVNAALRQIESVNAKIAGAKPGSTEAAALLDERQRALDIVAEFLPIQTVARDSGTVDVLTSEGVFLVVGEARQLEFTQSDVFTADQTLAGGALSGLTLAGVDLTPSAVSYGAVSSGKFSALFTQRDQDVPAFDAKLDGVAADLIARFSDPSVDPTLAAGEAGIFTDSSAAGGPGLAGRITLNTALDEASGGGAWRLRDGLGATTPGNEGNSTLLKGMIGALTARQPSAVSGLQGSFSSTELVANFASNTGANRIHHDSVMASANAQHTALIEAERADTAVDLDAQMQDLLLIEQSYAANARIIEIASQMLDQLMEL